MTHAMTTAQAIDSETAGLKRSVRRTQFEKKAIAVCFILPAFLFLVVNFLVPVGAVLFKSVDDREVTAVLHRTTRAIATWDGSGLPDEVVFAAIVDDLKEGRKARTLFMAAKRLNTARSGFQALLGRTARALSKMQSIDSPKETLIELDKRWGERGYWITIERTAKPYTFVYLLAAFDLTLDDEGGIVQVPEKSRLFNRVWLRTFWMGFVITSLCVIMGYPLAYLMAQLPPRISSILMFLVLIPFWTALLVRTSAWIVLLQNEGVVNDWGLLLNLWAERVQFIHNRVGVYVAMSQILLPFMVLPLFAIMRRIPQDYMRAAQSLGANPLTAFVRVYWPLTRHGVGAGGLFVFILAVGFYITPELVGGPNDQMVSFFIAFYASESLNWGMAAALSTILLLFKGILFYVLNVTFGISKLRIGHA